MSVTDQLPPLRQINPADPVYLETVPVTRIQTNYDIAVWRKTRGYQDYSIFLRRLNESVVGKYLPLDGPSEIQFNPLEAILSIISILDTLEGWIEEIPPMETPQRFGNLSFRKWGKRLEERIDDLLNNLLSPEFHPIVPHLKPYLITSFGSFTRMDYGTGHETSFALFLLCLTLVRFFQPVLHEERELVLRVFVRYLRLCWKLQDVYKLEPAGSHGVWGLDDSSFLGYVFGSGQLRDQTEIPVSAVLHPPLPLTNLYFMLIMRIHDVKHGPFHEHSSQLYSIATGVPNWNKVNSGLFKMYEAEVLGKTVVVQHIPLGGLLEWNMDPPVTAPVSSPSSIQTAATAAPWAASSRAGASPTIPSWYNSPTSNIGMSATANRTTRIPRNTPAEYGHPTIGPPS